MNELGVNRTLCCYNLGNDSSIRRTGQHCLNMSTTQYQAYSFGNGQVNNSMNIDYTMETQQGTVVYSWNCNQLTCNPTVPSLNTMPILSISMQYLFQIESFSDLMLFNLMVESPAPIYPTMDFEHFEHFLVPTSVDLSTISPDSWILDTKCDQPPDVLVATDSLHLNDPFWQYKTITLSEIWDANYTNAKIMVGLETPITMSFNLLIPNSYFVEFYITIPENNASLVY